MSHVVYIIDCNDRSLYVGHTNNLPQRIEYHKRGCGSQHMAQRGFRQLIYKEILADETSAVQRELQLKKWSRAKKLALACGNLACLKELSRSRD